MKFFLAQINPTVGDLGGNAEKILDIAGLGYSNSSDFIDLYESLKYDGLPE